MHSDLNLLRLDILKQISRTSSFVNSWPVWKAEIERSLLPNATGQKVFDLGERLSDIFRSNSEAGRSQSSLSGGGTAWECLIIWYMNFIFWSTPVLATRPNKALLPQIISDAISVTIGGHRTNTESDILVFTVPDPTSLQLPEKRKDHFLALNEHLSSRVANSRLAIVQCKTNWNDNAQIPMLWDLLYNSTGTRIKSVSIGSGGVHPHSFADFSYSFVTVPTTTRGQYKETDLSVLRVRNLTGGNYWGKSTKSGVVACVNEFFARNFPSAFKGGVKAHLDKQIADNAALISAFLTLDWKLLE